LTKGFYVYIQKRLNSKINGKNFLVKNNRTRNYEKWQYLRRKFPSPEETKEGLMTGLQRLV
jgi:hypothetical protein